ncbi:MAG: flagellar basal-body rod protein FlgF [Planctomycetota bacterium]
MPYGLYVSAEGAQAQSQRLEVIANNLANVNTVGFKPDQAAFQARFAEAIQEGHAAAGDRSVHDVGGGVKVIETLTDYTAGRLQHTGSDSDVAIIGEGFFQVAGEGEEPLLTRAGNFRVDPDGRLLTGDGRPVLDSGGAGIQLAPNVEWNISKDGFVQQGGGAVELAIVQPESLSDLTKVGTNVFASRGPVNPVAETAREVRPGTLEMSAANPTQQMMAMIEASRAFEANARMIQTQDAAMQGLVGRLLRVA